MTARLDHLIADLGADLRPVRRLASPWLRAAAFLAGVAALGAALACFADLAAMAARLRAVPDLRLAMLGSTVTAVLATLAAFAISVPGRSAAWTLLPLPGLVLWVAATGAGCLRAEVAPALALATGGEMRDCFGFIVSLSVPLSALMIAMIRRACPLRPNLTAATAGLAVAAAAASLLNLFHPYDAGATDIATHLAAIGLVIGVNRLLGGRLLAGARAGLSPRLP